MQLLAFVISAFALATSAAAEIVHIHPIANASLCVGPTSLVAPQDHQLVALPCGTSNATSSDLTAITVTTTELGQYTQFRFGDMCVSARLAAPPDATDFVPCTDDYEQLWTFTADGTIEDLDGTCLTLGRPGSNAPTTLATCLEFPDKQGWTVEVISA